MKKITDRCLLGIISGLTGNVAKLAVENLFNRIGFSQAKGSVTAAGIFLKKSDISTPHGNIVGHAADNMIAAALGVSCAYWLTLMGKDHYLLKGAGLGALEWGALHGVLSRLGATSIYPVKPKDAIATFVSHLVFGATKITTMVMLGDERLFKPKNSKIEITQPEPMFNGKKQLSKNRRPVPLSNNKLHKN